MSYLEGPKMQNDPVRPGEQWFCYWKTSAALWESRILASPVHEVIFIPLYWGLHTEAPGSWDFGQVQPEKDLLRLAQLLTQHGRRFCWLLPLTPSPFLPNGGVPVASARTLSISAEGVHLAVLDSEDKLNKMYSFFEPKVFQSYVEFLKVFGAFLGTNKIKSPVWGVSFEYLSGDKVISYLEDYSIAFEQGFSRYLKKNHKTPEGVELKDPYLEGKLKSDFTREVQELFATTGEGALAPFWMGRQTITVLGGSPKETIERSLPGGKPQFNLFRELFTHYAHGRRISTALLKGQEKGELLPHVLVEHFGAEEVERRYHYQSIHGELSAEWSPFGLVDLIEPGEGTYRETGLISYLEQHHQWLYQVLGGLAFTTEWIEANQHKVKFFYAEGMNRTAFSQMLKLFMMGQKIVLDSNGLHPDLDKRLQVFFLENNLKLQTVNFVTSTTLCELGEGAFITYDGAKLKNAGQANQFWQNLFGFFKLVNPEVKADKEVFSMWRIRAATAHELSYLDVRRVNLYNPTSYKKHVVIHTQNRFAFMKMIDPAKASAKSVSHGVEVELLPQGRIALDFGHYEER